MQIDPQLLGEEEQTAERSCETPEETPEIDRARRLGYNPQLPCAYDPQLEYDRRRNKEKLRSRFEQIFEKYERDFQGIGDEIDLQTGKIVVDNGHIKHMRHEADTGGDESSSIVQAISEKVERDGDLGGFDESGSEGQSEDDEDQASTSGDTSNGDLSGQPQAADSPPSSFEADDPIQEVYHKAPLTSAYPSQPYFRRTAADEPHARRENSVQDEVSEPSERCSPGLSLENTVEQVPDFRESMLALQSKYKDGQSVNPIDIQAISTKIAEQIAAFLSRGTEQLSKDPTWSYPGLPGDSPKQRKKHSPSPLPASAASSPRGESLWAPMRHPRPRKRRRVTQATSEQQARQGDESLLFPEVHEGEQQASCETRPAGVRTCSNCDSVDTSTWRNGPDGDLCNPCGMYYYRYGLLRPMDESEDESDVDAEDYESGHPENTPPPVSTISAKCSRFTLEEDAEVIKLKEIENLSWEKISTHFEGRSAYALQCRYSKKLHGRHCEAREILVGQGHELIDKENGSVTFANQTAGWTAEEDGLLLRLLGEDGGNWNTIALSFPGRTAEALERCTELVQGNLDGEYMRRKSKKKDRRERLHERLGQKYSREEDELIVRLREVDKLKWAELADRFPGRNAVSLQKRYVRDLRKHSEQIDRSKGSNDEVVVQETMTREPVDVDSTVINPCRESDWLKNVRYTAEEDELLMYLRNVQEMRWEDIEPMLPGRNRLSLFNRWSYIQMKQPTRKLHYKQQEDEPTLDPDLDPISAQLQRELHKDNEDTSMREIPGTALNHRPTVQLGSEPRAEASDASLDIVNQQPRTGFDKLLAKDVFTEDEDKLIVKLREVEGLRWEDIAAQMSDRNVSSITRRYFQYLLPAKEENTQRSTQVSSTLHPTTPSDIEAPLNKSATIERLVSASPAPRSRWSRHEADLLGTLRAQGMSWIDIAERLPGRTENSVKAYHSKFISTKRRSWPWASGHTAQKSETPLIRQALDNYTLRQSESAVPPTNLNSTLQDCMFDSVGDGGLSMSGSERAAQSNEQSPAPQILLPSALTEEALEPAATGSSGGAFGQCAEASATPAQTNPESSDAQVLQQRPAKTPHDQEQTLTYPESPVQSAQSSQPYFDASPIETTSYITPARSSYQALPYYVAPPAPMYAPPVAKQPLQWPSPVGLEGSTTVSADKAQAVGREKELESGETRPAHNLPTPPEHTVKPGGDGIRHEEKTEAEDKPPAPCWADLNTAALKSNLPHPMAATAIYRYYEMSFPSAISDRHNWKNRVSATLYNKPQFEKVYDNRRLLWALTSDEKLARILSQARKRRGRPPKNGPWPESNEVQEPEKSGRPPKPRGGIGIAGCDGDGSNETSEPAGDGSGSQATNPNAANRGDLPSPTRGRTAHDRSSSYVTALTEQRMPDHGVQQATVAPTQAISSNAGRDPESLDGAPHAHDGVLGAEESLNDQSSDPPGVTQQVPPSSSPVLKADTPARVSSENTTPDTGRSTLFGHLQQQVSSALRFASPWAGLPASTPASVVPLRSTMKAVHVDVQSAPRTFSVAPSRSAKPGFHKLMPRASRASSVVPVSSAKRASQRSMPGALRASGVVPLGGTKRFTHTPTKDADDSEDELAL